MKWELNTMKLCIGMAFSCYAETYPPLDFNTYYNQANRDSIYPSAKQIEMLKVVIPKESFQPAPPVTNRIYWDEIAASASGKEYLNKALSELDKKPEVPITDETYREANRKGHRGMYAVSRKE